MSIAIRVDSSIEIGSGHVMRCLTLANRFKQRGSSISFICRDHPGNLISLIKENGFRVFILPLIKQVNCENTTKLFHSDWLGSSQEEDANECSDILKKIKPKLLIIDHYAIDIVWENSIKNFAKNIMVIDDLVDRSHDCNFLLDQTYQRNVKEYNNLILSECVFMIGSDYALIRPEFLKYRPYSLKRRASAEFQNLIINLGGVDKDNITSLVIDSIQNINLPSSFKINVVMGKSSPHIKKVQEAISRSNFSINLNVGIKNIEELMSEADIAIGAPGSTSWERCCLGIPSILIILAKNQKDIAKSLNKKKVVKIINKPNDIKKLLPNMLEQLKNNPKELQSMSFLASAIVDGLGVERIIHKLEADIDGI